MTVGNKHNIIQNFVRGQQAERKLVMPMISISTVVRDLNQSNFN